jgi:phosphatidylglycerol:prolipoprotein diacylglycerol transferase
MELNMRRVLLPIYGPFAIHSYGLAIAIGLFITIYLVRQHPWFQQLKLEDRFTEIILLCMISALIGGRCLFLLTEPEHIRSFGDIWAFWQGGLSLLGAILGVLAVLPFYLYRMGIPILRFFDLAALHAPLLQSIARVGCFFAGCCYGRMTEYSWGVIYTDTLSSAPLNLCIHPAQLYSAFSLLIIFMILYFFLQKVFTKPGEILCSYLVLMGAERFLTDFWRADQTFFSFDPNHLFSANQIISLMIIAGALLGFFLIRRDGEYS